MLGSHPSCFRKLEIVSNYLAVFCLFFRKYSLILERLLLIMRMKNTVLPILLQLALIFLLSVPSAAQTTSQLPPFSMTLSNGQYFNAAQLPKGKPVLLMYFDPECDHCHTLMNAFFKRPADFRSAEVLIVTFKPLNEVQAFVKAYQTHRYPNIKVGTEGTTYYLRNYYRMQNTPFVALYNRGGSLIAGYQKEVPLDALHKQLKKA
jgi:thioredoxin-related protein